MWTWSGYQGPTILEEILWNFWRPNLYASKDWRWNQIETGMKVRTYFRVIDAKTFLNSALQFIDEIKTTESEAYSAAKCLSVLQDLAAKKIDEY